LLLLLLTVLTPARAETVISDELDARYDCALRLRPTANAGTVTLALEGAVRVTVSRTALTVVSVVKGKETRLFTGPSGVRAGEEFHLTVLRRDGWLGLLHGASFRYRGAAPRGAGKTATLTAGTGWTVLTSRVQALEPVAFADNFMRAADEQGEWMARAGHWGLRSAWDADPKGNAHRFEHAATGQNPFAWYGAAAVHSARPGSAGLPTGAALCTAGHPYWEDYTLSVAVSPMERGAVGAVVNMPAPDDGLLVRWSPANDRTATGNRLGIYRLRTGELLAEDAGGYVSNQWYRLQVVSGFDGTVRVLVDGRQRLAITDAVPWRGGVGLYVEGQGVFDDVTVYGRELKQDLLAESQLSHLTRRFLDDKQGMGKWAGADADWQSAAEGRVHRLDFYGDHWLTLSAKPLAGGGGMTLALGCAETGELAAGFRAAITAEANGTAYTLYRRTEVIARGKGPALTAGEEYAFRLRRAGTTLLLEVDGEVVATADDVAPLPGLRPAYATPRGFTLTQPPMALGARLVDDVFAEAPVAWEGHGTWRQTVRWSCSPEWSFLGGWSPGEAALWYKARVEGDQTFQAYTGFLMEYPRERDSYHDRYHNLAITICGDGMHPRSGYAGIYGAPDAAGQPNRRTVLLRDGVEVASAQLAIPPFDPQTHRNWYELRLVKRGAEVSFYVEGTRVLTYTDPKPLTGGVPAIWTANNGIALARARLSSAAPPVPRRETPVILAQPAYPEWTDIGTPLTLDFAGSWSAAGTAVALKAAPELAPSADALTIDGLRVTFAPTKPGWYWYRLTAGDGERRSPEYHLLIRVFDPRAGRDDAQALVLYRFDEGQGNRVRDRGAAPALDLTLPDGAAWLPGQGLSLLGATGPALSAKPAAKLRALAEKKAFTVEAWVSNPTVHPVNNRANILSWESGPGRWNVAVGHCEEHLMAVPSGVAYLSITNRWAALATGFRTGLTHLAVTWDGRMATGYLNGARAYQRYIPLNPQRWTVSAPLLLAMHSDLTDHYLGTYYLAAIHAACLTPEQIQRHYAAGPGAAKGEAP